MTLAEDVSVGNTVVGLAWLDDGTILYEQLLPESDRPRRIVRISEDGGEPLDVIFPIQEAAHPMWVHGLPDAQAALVIACPGATISRPNRANLYVVNLDDLSFKLLLEQVARAWYASTGQIVCVRADGAVLAVPFDLAALEFTASPIPLFEGVRVVGGYADAVLGADGTFLYVEGEPSPTPGRQLVWVDRSGREEPLDPDLSPRGFTTLALSPDDQRLAVSIVASGQLSDLWVKELPDGPLTRLSTDPGGPEKAVWSADGATIAYITRDGGSTHARTVRLDGSLTGAFQVLLQLSRPVLEVLFTPDERSLVFRAGDARIGAADLGLVDLETGTVDEDLLASEFNERAIALSPDGRWLAYVSDVTGRDEIYVRPFPSAETGRAQVSTNGGIEPVWAHNGGELFYRELEGGSMVAATYRADSNFVVEGRERLFDASPYLVGEAGNWHSYDVTRDDERFVMMRSLSVAGETVGRLVLVTNFFEELRQRMGN